MNTKVEKSLQGTRIMLSRDQFSVTHTVLTIKSFEPILGEKAAKFSKNWWCHLERIEKQLWKVLLSRDKSNNFKMKSERNCSKVKLHYSINTKEKEGERVEEERTRKRKRNKKKPLPLRSPGITGNTYGIKLITLKNGRDKNLASTMVLLYKWTSR